LAAWGDSNERSFFGMVVKPDWDIPPAFGADASGSSRPDLKKEA